MKPRAIKALLASIGIGIALLGGNVWAMDEAVLTPTNKAVVAEEDKEFNAAMGVWLTHRYGDGEKMLREFAAKHPNSRWAAEAELHCGCYLTFSERYDEARTLFEKLATKHSRNNIHTKATLRLGNVAERQAKFDEAIKHYTDALSMNPTWDQFKYANYSARKLIMGKGKMQAMINCGPVALAACLNALGKTSEATQAREIKPTLHGISLYVLSSESEKLGVKARLVEMSSEQLCKSTLPVLAYVQPNHFVAVLSIKDKTVGLEDSIRGKHDVSLSELERVWSGRVLSFAPDTKLASLSIIDALDATGGCCAQADEDECLGASPQCECQQGTDDGNGGSGGPCGSGAPCASGGPPSGGSPTWKMNTNNFNVMVTDTPIWYNPGKGPGVAFTLHYSNENSNTGIFGRGWRCLYDTIVHFLPPGNNGHPDLQLHRDNGRIETYQWDQGSSSYKPREFMRNYGYHDTIEKLTDGTVVLSLSGGGKYYFMPEGGPAEGRIHFVEDALGNRVTCEYIDGKLAHVIDASSGVTDIETTGSGIDERVTKVTIPEYDTQTHQPGHGNGRFAEFSYTNGNLTSITDMAGSTSTLSYGATVPWNASAWLSQDVTADPAVPDNGEDLYVYSWDFMPKAAGWIEVSGTQGNETIHYSSTDGYGTLSNITRGNPKRDFSMNDEVVGYTGVPYLNTIVTPTKKTKFVYNWWMNPGARATTVVSLHEVYECGRDEYPDINTYPSVPTVHYEWNWYDTAVTRYPTSVTPTLTGGITKHYLSVSGPLDDALFKIVDEAGNTVVDYGYDYATRNRTSVKDGKGNETKYTFDNNRNVTKVEGPTGTVRNYTYYADNSLHEEKNAAGQVVKSHTYNSAGQLTQVDSALGTQLINHYDAQGRLEYKEDGRGKRTYYGYNDNGETRGFLTSVTDPESHVTRYRYDGKGRRCEVTDAGNNTTSYEYDDLDRITKVTNPDGSFVETHYSCCHQEWVKDENGKMTRYDFDKRNRLWATISAAIDTTLAQGISAADTQIPLTSVAGFPASGTVLLKSVDGDAEIVKYGGINGNTLTGVTRGQFGTTAKAFSAANATEGNVLVDVYDEDVKDGNGNYIHRGILNRKVGQYDANGHLTQFAYFANGRLQKTSYPDDTWEQYTYDTAGNMVTKKYGHGTDTITKTINYDYDASNRLVGSYGQ